MARCALRVGSAVAGLLVLASCSSGPTLSEYAEDLEALVVEMDTAMADIAFEPASQEPTLDELRSYVDEELAIISDFVSAFRLLDPPTQAEPIHASALGVLERLLVAEQTFATELADDSNFEGTSSFAEALARIEQSEALRQLRAADNELDEICRAAQDQFDATEEQALAEGTPWVPTELKEVIRVSLSCDSG